MLSAPDKDDITMTVNGIIYSGWTSIALETRLDRMTTRFTCGCVEKPGRSDQAWQLAPFSPFVLKIGSDVVLTGYLDDHSVELGPETYTATVTGRSKTADLIDCAPDISSGQYKGYQLEQIARSVCQMFGIGVVVQTPATQIFPDATLQRGETAFTFLERLARLSGVLLTDDVNGNLVLTTAGVSKASTALKQGVNVLRASSKLDVRKRFSDYIVKGQRAIGSASASGAVAGFGTSHTAPPAPIAPVITNQVARAKDAGVPRYRPTVLVAEAQLDQAGMQLRANWERNYALGRATEAEVTVSGWRQSDGTLWRLNQLASVSLPYLAIDQDLLVVGVDFRLDNTNGRSTTLRVGPIEGYTPDPGEVKVHCRRGKKGKTAPAFDGFGSGAAPANPS